MKITYIYFKICSKF